METEGLQYLKGIGAARVKALARLGITDRRSLLTYFPRAWEDRTKLCSIAELPVGEEACVLAVVAQEPVSSHIRKGMDLLKVRVVDGADALFLTFFNQPYLKSRLIPGEAYVFYGKTERKGQRKEMVNPLFEPEGAKKITGRILPVYSLTAGIRQSTLQNAIAQVLREDGDAIVDILPDEMRMHYTLCHARYAYENIHFPVSPEALQMARRRLTFEEMLLLCAGMRLMRGHMMAQTGPVCRPLDLSPFYESLPYAPTGAQTRAIEDAVNDMCSGRPMSRLCQGDVGSGKTTVAAACVYFAVRNGCQAAMMAPTELLARQHYRSLAPLLERLGLHCALLTGSMTAKEKRGVYAALTGGETDFIIGTHALLSEGVAFSALGLVITDEQHRFGVAQRAALSAKAAAQAEGEVTPHVLVMSATPIPRTLALMIYGDLDISVIDELPPGRQSIDTFALPGSYHTRLYRFIRKLAAQGQQTYIVCPLVEGTEDAGKKAVTEYTETLKRDVFPDLRIDCVHGKMKAAAKDAVMRAFADGQTDILVSTTVIEVGVDVPNAVLMVVENAERFGLSQLHQLRGRVGRGTHKSYCVLFSDTKGETAWERLQVMTRTGDGFEIAQKDLELRGPGDFLGHRQHGLPALKLADLQCDGDVMRQAHRAAEELLRDDPLLRAPQHRHIARQIEALFHEAGGTIN